MPASRPDFASVYALLRPLLACYEDRLTVVEDSPNAYTLKSKLPSPFKQHKGRPLFFAGIRVGKASVSYHLLPLYMSPELSKKISPALQKRMQGKACFNFKTEPESGLLEELASLTEAGFVRFRAQLLV